jgi:hypothetical protein
MLLFFKNVQDGTAGLVYNTVKGIGCFCFGCFPNLNAFSIQWIFQFGWNEISGKIHVPSGCFTFSINSFTVFQIFFYLQYQQFYSKDVFLGQNLKLNNWCIGFLKLFDFWKMHSKFVNYDLVKWYSLWKRLIFRKVHSVYRKHVPVFLTLILLCTSHSINTTHGVHIHTCTLQAFTCMCVQVNVIDIHAYPSVQQIF